MLRKLSAGPYLVWMILFTVVPLFLILFYALTIDGSFTFENFTRAFEPIYLSVIGRSLVIAVKATLLCLLLGYPMAMILSKMRPKYRTLAVMLFVVPMWMNFLLRTYALITILGKNGILNSILSIFGVQVDTFLFNEGAVLLAMVYNFLPFMVLPIYTVLTKMDKSLFEAAEDLGAGRLTTFGKVTLPLSLPGVISGISMVFMPAVSTFVISDLMYGGQYMLVGNLIDQQFKEPNLSFASAISLLLMVLILVSMGVMNKLSGGKREVSIW